MKYFVRLVEGSGLVSRAIQLKGFNWPTHVEMLRLDDANENPTVLSSRYPKGVQIRGYKDYPVKREAWYVHRSEPSACERAWHAMESIIGHTYDLTDIFGIALATDWHVDGRYICSEAVAWAFEQPIALEGESEPKCFPVFNTDQPTRRIIPAHFLLTPLLWRVAVL